MRWNYRAYQSRDTIFKNLVVTMYYLQNYYEKELVSSVELANILRLKLASTSRALKRLLNQNYVTRIKNGSRAYGYSLTHSGIYYANKLIEQSTINGIDLENIFLAVYKCNT